MCLCDSKLHIIKLQACFSSIKIGRDMFQDSKWDDFEKRQSVDENFLLSYATFKKLTIKEKQHEIGSNFVLWIRTW